MLVVSDSAKGAVSLVFHSEFEVKKFIANLEKMVEYKKLPGETYPATYTEHLAINPKENDIDSHIKSAKRAVNVVIA